MIGNTPVSVCREVYSRKKDDRLHAAVNGAQLLNQQARWYITCAGVLLGTAGLKHDDANLKALREAVKALDLVEGMLPALLAPEPEKKV